MPTPQPRPEGERSAAAAQAVATAKVALRDQVLTARRRRPLVELGAAARALTEVVVATQEVRRAATVACYVSVGSEPGTTALLDALLATGKRGLLPVLLPDNDLDWATYAGPESLAAAGRGLLEPVTPCLGVEAVATADVVLVPGVAVGRDGMRLGRGGGSYDRALARVPLGTFTCVLLHDDEVLARVPAAPHDRPVTAAATPSGLLRF